MIDIDATKSHPKKESLIRVRNLKKRFSEDGPWVLNDISFDIHTNETVAIIGTSGCGKLNVSLIKKLLAWCMKNSTW